MSSLPVSTEMNPEVLALRISYQEKEMAELQARHDSDIRELRNIITNLETASAEREAQRALEKRNALISGIAFLGTLISVLVGVIWANRGVIFKG